jgi:hypothetical protein
MERVWSRAGTGLGLILGIGPALLAHVFPQAVLLNQLNLALVGAIIGARAGNHRPACPPDVPANHARDDIGMERSSR